MIRFAKKSIQSLPVARKFCSVAAAETNFGSHESPFKKYEYYFRGRWQPYTHNPACDALEANKWSSDRITVYKYVPVMGQALYYETLKDPYESANAIAVSNGIKMAHPVIRKHLIECRTRMVSSSEEISQVGTVAANGDRKIGELVAKAIQKVGHTDSFILSDKKKPKYKLEFDKGMSLNWGLISPFFITNKEEEACVLKNPLIIIYDNKISSTSICIATKELVLNITKRPLLVITKDIDREDVASLVLDWRYLGLKVCILKPLEHTEDTKDFMQDLAILTGGQVINSVIEKETGYEVLSKTIGSCKEVRATRDKMIIIGGSGSQAAIEERCEQLRCKIKLSPSDDEVKLLEERLAKLSGGVAFFKVGGDSKEEVINKNKRVVHAIQAANAAIETGIVPGGGVALLHASKELDKLQVKNCSEKLGVQLYQHALKIPVYSIASSAGFDGLATVEKLLQQDNPDIGYDPATDEYVDMIKAGNVDPLKLIISELDELYAFARYHYAIHHQSDLD